MEQKIARQALERQSRGNRCGAQGCGRNSRDRLKKGREAQYVYTKNQATQSFTGGYIEEQAHKDCDDYQLKNTSQHVSRHTYPSLTQCEAHNELMSSYFIQPGKCREGRQGD